MTSTPVTYAGLTGTMFTARPGKHYPRIGSTVTVTFKTRAGSEQEYSGMVYADRYPDYALNVGELRIPWSFITDVR